MHVHLGALEDVAVSVALVPYFSLLTMLLEAVGGVDRGLPAAHRSAIARAVGARGRAALTPIGASSDHLVPECLFPIAPRADSDIQTSVQALRTSAETDVATNLAAEFGEPPPAPWRTPTAHPHRWMTDFADAVEATADCTSALVQRSGPLLDREVERIGIASVHGSTSTLLSNLTPRISLQDDTLHFQHVLPGRYDLAGRRLVLVPIIAGSRMLMTNFESPDMIWIGYPLPGLGQVWRRSAPARPEDPLEILLGYARASILRFLSRPARMSELADTLDCAPNTITFHCRRLEAAGLIDRRRVGREIRVSRSTRGEELLDLIG